MFSQNTNKLQIDVWFCSVLVVILFFPTAKPQNNLHNLVRVFVVRLTYSTRSLEEFKQNVQMPTITFSPKPDKFYIQTGSFFPLSL